MAMRGGLSTTLSLRREQILTRFRCSFRGAGRMFITKEGDLVIKLGGGEIDMPEAGLLPVRHNLAGAI